MSHLSAIIVFNTDRYFERQYDLFKKNVEGDIILIDNSTDYFISRNLRQLTKKLGCDYIKTAVNEADFSRSHAYACTVAYNLSDGYDTLLLADHDIFPTKPFPIHLYNENILCGVQQMRPTNSIFGAENKVYLEYMQPVLLLLNKKELQNVEVDFYPCIVRETFLDTGGGLYKIVMGNKDRCHFFSEKHEEKDGYMYSVIERDWIHFINGSNWKKDEEHEKRVQTLLTLL